MCHFSHDLHPNSFVMLLSPFNLIIPIILSKAPAHLLIIFLALYLLHFPTIYPLSKVALPNGRVGTAQEPSKTDFFPFLKNVMPLPIFPPPLSLSLSLSLVIQASYHYDTGFLCFPLSLRKC